jgi:hypothetical protein
MMCDLQLGCGADSSHGPVDKVTLSLLGSRGGPPRCQRQCMQSLLCCHAWNSGSSTHAHIADCCRRDEVVARPRNAKVGSRMLPNLVTGCNNFLYTPLLVVQWHGIFAQSRMAHAATLAS